MTALVCACVHSMEEADLLSDTIAIMHEGRIRAVGTRECVHCVCAW